MSLVSATRSVTNKRVTVTHLEEICVAECSSGCSKVRSKPEDPVVVPVSGDGSNAKGSRGID